MSDLIRAAALNQYVAYAVSQGLDGLAQIDAAGLPRSCLEQPDTYISYSRIVRLFDDSARASGNDFFGLELGLLQGMAPLGALTYLMCNCATVREAINNLIRFLRVHTGGAHGRLKVSKDRASLQFEFSEGQAGNVRQILERSFGVGLRMMRMLCGPEWEPTAVLAQTAPGRPLGNYRRLMGVMPQFNADRNAIVFAREWLDRPLTGADPELRRLMREQLERLDNMYRDELPASVVQLIRGLLPQGQATVETISRHLDLSPRSLQRHLSAEGTSFQALLDETRRSLAEQYLRDSSLQVVQLATLVGYTEHSTFTRAFNRWFGCSPTRWMKDRDIRSQQRRIRHSHKRPRIDN